MKDDYENGLTQLAATLRQHRMSGPAGFALRARDALGRRERALRNIKGAWYRWYDGTADAESTLRDIESFAVGVWMQEEDIANAAGEPPATRTHGQH